MPKPDPLETLRDKIADTLIHAGVTNDKIGIKFEIPPDPTLGHIALACFKFAAAQKKNPALIAKDIARLPFPTVFHTIKPVGPYVNFFVDMNTQSATLFSYLDTRKDYGASDALTGKTIMVEFSSPNTNKPLHLGHGRNNTLGMTLANLLAKCGATVVRSNLVNDRGIHICKSMLAYRLFGNGATPESTGIKSDRFVGEYYVKYAQKEKIDPELEPRVRDMLLKWERNDPDVRALWRKMNQWVLDGFEQTYRRTGVTFDRIYRESDLFVGGKDEVMNALKKGLCKTEENGAISIDLSDCKLGKKILLRHDGTAIYMTQDIYTTVCKYKEYPLDGNLFVVGNEQDNHFRTLFAVLKKFGYAWADTCEHISYGMITLPEGRMKSREGTVVDLDDLLDAVKSDALRELKLREETKPEPRTEKTLTNTAEYIAQAAIKFMMLRTNANRDFIFDPKESVSFEGATGPYLQYTHARICSILSRASVSGFEPHAENYAWSDDEGLVVYMLLKFPGVVLAAATERNPAILAMYAYDTAKQFNKFYNARPILKSDKSARASRLNLCLAVKKILADSLTLMTIKPLERM